MKRNYLYYLLIFWFLVAGSGFAQNKRENEDVIKVETQLIDVPVVVTDKMGKPVLDLRQNNFAVFEDGKKQNLNFFTTDPFALSAAVILDTGMPDVALQKVNQTFGALEGAFSQFDEVSLYTYSTSVTRSPFQNSGSCSILV